MTTNLRQRGEHGHAEGTLLRRLTMVCLVVLVVSGLVVYWVGETTPPHTAAQSPAVGQPNPSEDKARNRHQLTGLREGGGL
ncbi:MAG: hypothetical protein ACRDPQ_15735 [Nocardioidaceae bacterium]